MSLERIIEIQEERIKREKEMFYHIYDKIESKINNYASMQSIACYYTIPEYIFGYPLVNIPKTMEYIVAKLNKKGFIAIQTSPDTLYISWELSTIKAQKLREKQKAATNSQISLEEDIEKTDDDFLSILVNSKKKSRFTR